MRVVTGLESGMSESRGLNSCWDSGEGKATWLVVEEEPMAVESAALAAGAVRSEAESETAESVAEADTDMPAASDSSLSLSFL